MRNKYGNKLAPFFVLWGARPVLPPSESRLFGSEPEKEEEGRSPKFPFFVLLGCATLSIPSLERIPAFLGSEPEKEGAPTSPRAPRIPEPNRGVHKVFVPSRLRARPVHVQLGRGAPCPRRGVPPSESHGTGKL